MENAGAIITTMDQIVSELAIDWISPNGQKLQGDSRNPPTIRNKEISMPADTILHNGRIATNGVPSFVEAVAITDGKITAIGSDREILRLRGPHTRIIDASGRTVIPGLNDSHMHPIRAGLSYNMELRW